MLQSQKYQNICASVKPSPLMLESSIFQLCARTSLYFLSLDCDSQIACLVRTGREYDTTVQHVAGSGQTYEYIDGEVPSSGTSDPHFSHPSESRFTVMVPRCLARDDRTRSKSVEEGIAYRNNGGDVGGGFEHVLEGGIVGVTFGGCHQLFRFADIFASYEQLQERGYALQNSHRKM